MCLYIDRMKYCQAYIGNSLNVDDDKDLNSKCCLEIIDHRLKRIDKFEVLPYPIRLLSDHRSIPMSCVRM